MRLRQRCCSRLDQSENRQAAGRARPPGENRGFCRRIAALARQENQDPLIRGPAPASSKRRLRIFFTPRPPDGVGRGGNAAYHSAPIFRRNARSGRRRCWLLGTSSCRSHGLLSGGGHGFVRGWTRTRIGRHHRRDPGHPLSSGSSRSRSGEQPDTGSGRSAGADFRGVGDRSGGVTAAPGDRTSSPRGARR
jgi:hypothetical protein